MTLNNILASPAFQSWREGQSLDIQSLLYTAQRQAAPQHFLSCASLRWRAHVLRHTPTLRRRNMDAHPKRLHRLRALLYMDEIFGYLPPTANPPSKQPLLRMLKQARAFGLGFCSPPKTPSTWITKPSPTQAHGSSANCKPSATRTVCSMVSKAWRAASPRRNGQAHLVHWQARLCHEQCPRQTPHPVSKPAG
jgi:hypothetical protein